MDRTSTEVRSALDELQQQVRAEPADGKHRVFLFQLLALLGDWNRALTQLEVSGDLDPGNLAMVQVYREALRCEALRAEVFAGRRSPLIFGEPEEWIASLVHALAVDAQGDQAQAKAREQHAGAMQELTGGLELPGLEEALGALGEAGLDPEG